MRSVVGAVEMIIDDDDNDEEYWNKGLAVLPCTELFS